MGKDDYSMDEIVLLSQTRPWEGYASQETIEELKKEALNSIERYKVKENYLTPIIIAIKKIKAYVNSDDDNKFSGGNKISALNVPKTSIESTLDRTPSIATGSLLMEKLNGYVEKKAEEYKKPVGMQPNPFGSTCLYF